MAYNVKFAAPVLQASIHGEERPLPDAAGPVHGAKPAITGRVVSLTSAGYVVDVTIGTLTERVTLTSSGPTIVTR